MGQIWNQFLHCRACPIKGGDMVTLTKNYIKVICIWTSFYKVLKTNCRELYIQWAWILIQVHYPGLIAIVLITNLRSQLWSIEASPSWHQVLYFSHVLRMETYVSSGSATQLFFFLSWFAHFFLNRLFCCTLVFQCCASDKRLPDIALLPQIGPEDTQNPSIVLPAFIPRERRVHRSEFQPFTYLYF